MNREIKFRAWNKENKKMINWKQIIHNTSFNLFGGLFELFRREEFVALQYTGLKDKNGKEIYEGDIVKFEMIRTVLADHPVMVATTEETAIYQGAVKWGEFGWRPFVDGKVKNFEVIGNIYENKELLK